MKSQGSGSQCRVEKGGADGGGELTRGPELDTAKNVDTIPTTKYKYGRARHAARAGEH